jgi:hypothetical protein
MVCLDVFNCVTKSDIFHTVEVQVGHSRAVRLRKSLEEAVQFVFV